MTARRDECRWCAQPIVGRQSQNGIWHWWHVATNDQACAGQWVKWAEPKAEEDNS